jgi:predicted component of type VI protein secretion system
MPALVFREGQLAGYRYDVPQEMSIGRENAAITLQDGEVSRRHAVIRPVEGGLEIQDLGSTNGTWVNDQRVSGATVVRPGDVLRLGQTSFSVELDQVVAAPHAPPPTPTQVSAPVPATAPTPAAVPAPFGQSQAPVQPPQGTFQGGRPTTRPRVATRGIVAMWVTFGVIVATAIALVLYFALRTPG